MRLRTLGALAAFALLTAGLPASASWADEERGFRIEPYLQNPGTDQMTITWFSRTQQSAKLELRGPGLPSGRTTYKTTPTEQSVLNYTDAERKQQISGLKPGSWLESGGNYKHSVDLTGLRPGSTYAYTVRQGTQTARETFRTAPSAAKWQHIRFVAMADSETEPAGRVSHYGWAQGKLSPDSQDRPSAEPGGVWDKKFGTTNVLGVPSLNYPLTEAEGYRRNLDMVERRDPDFVTMSGDIVQGGGYQPGWDEFFRQNAGEFGNGLSEHPILPALGNWENYGGFSGGYGSPEDRSPVVRARSKYHAYFDAPSNGTPKHRDNYYRVDYGPVTVLTLDSSNGEPDDHPDNYTGDEQATGQEYFGPDDDTQSNFTAEEYAAAGGTDLADINPGSPQWEWTQKQLADARAKDRIVFVQFHHAPYTDGGHGQPMYHERGSGQAGTPMRKYHAMFERYGVAAVLSGHAELFSRSFVDKDGDGAGVQYYDVGVAGDGFGVEARNGSRLTDPLLNYNKFSEWTADQQAPEHWEAVNGAPQLTDGGKHYGHLEVNVRRHNAERNGVAASITLTPVHSFPVLNDEYELVRTKRREYADEVNVHLNKEGEVIPESK